MLSPIFQQKPISSKRASPNDDDDDEPRKVDDDDEATAGMAPMYYDDDGAIIIGGCSEIRLVEDVVENCKKYPNVVFYSEDPNDPVIDFMYQDSTGHFHAFKAPKGVKLSTTPRGVKVKLNTPPDS